MTDPDNPFHDPFAATLEVTATGQVTHSNGMICGEGCTFEGHAVKGDQE